MGVVYVYNRQGERVATYHYDTLRNAMWAIHLGEFRQWQDYGCRVNFAQAYYPMPTS